MSAGAPERSTVLPSVDRRALQSVIRKAMGRPDAQLLAWDYEHIASPLKPDTPVYRFTGQARAGSRTLPCSVVLKIISVQAGAERPSEIRLYQSSILGSLRDSLCAPRCFRIDHPAPDSCRMWLENVQDESAEPWPVGRYALAARHLGHFGATQAGCTQLARGWLRRWIASAEQAVIGLPMHMSKPLVAKCYAGHVADSIAEVWRKRDLFLDALDRLPQTVCHFDAHRNNLRSRKSRGGDTQTVVLDWEYAGCGALGVDAAPMVGSTLAEGLLETDLAEQLTEDVFAGYLAGLHDRGWAGRAERVRLAYTTTLALRYTLGTTRFLLPALIEHDGIARLERLLGKSIAHITDAYATLFPFFLSRAREAESLIQNGAVDGHKA